MIYTNFFHIKNDIEMPNWDLYDCNSIILDDGRVSLVFDDSKLWSDNLPYQTLRNIVDYNDYVIIIDSNRMQFYMLDYYDVFTVSKKCSSINELENDAILWYKEMRGLYIVEFPNIES
jgi:hypothetical protein